MPKKNNGGNPRPARGADRPTDRAAEKRAPSKGAKGPKGAVNTKSPKNSAKVPGRNPNRGPKKKEQPAQAQKNAVKETKRPARRSRAAEGREQTRPYTGEKLRIISLGGLNEIGKNMTLFEYGDDIIVDDCGVAFPDDDLPGVDLVIPDFSYLLKNRDRVRGLIVTHGHEDHIGAIPYLLKELDIPVYGTAMTLGLLKKKLEEHGLDKKARLVTIKPHDVLRLGAFTVEAIRVNHSIADSLAFAITTPVGTVVHTGDFKVDTTPIQGEPIDLARFGELGREGVLALLMDSTNVERPGFAMSESKVGASFENIFHTHDRQRMIIATFASNVDRVQQIINAAAKYGRKVAISGRSMVNMLDVAMELGYISVPKGLIIDLDVIDRYPPENIVIVTTGSQGEPMSALYRMAYSDHRKVEVGAGDLVVLSSSAIPGNEKTISKMINELYKKGCEVIYESLSDVHVSGHACQEELKLILALTKPRFFIPVHGEYRHLARAAGLARSMGMDSKDIIINDIGRVVELTPDTCRLNGTVPSGRVLIDGIGIGDVGNIVLRDRMHLSQDGLIIVVVSMDAQNAQIVAGPDVVSRGFVYMRESEDLMERIRDVSRETVISCVDSQVTDWATIKTRIKGAVGNLLYGTTKRKPMILPIIMEV